MDHKISTLHRREGTQEGEPWGPNSSLYNPVQATMNASRHLH